MNESVRLPDGIPKTSKLQEAWPLVRSALEDYGILNPRLSLDERRLIFSTSEQTKKPKIINKAGPVLELLSTTRVPPSLAMEILSGKQKHVLIKIGDQEGGLCSKFGISKEEYVKRRECLFSSLEDLAGYFQHSVFINENTVAVVGRAPRTIKNIVEDCIVKNVCPATAVEKIILSFKWHVWKEDLEDPHKKHLEMECSDEYGYPEMAFLYMNFPVDQDSKFNQLWPMVESSLKDYGISCRLELDRLAMEFLTPRTGDPNIIYKAWDLLELLSKTVVPASKAIEILNGSLQHDLIKIGYQEGGLCSRFGIKKEQFVKRRQRLKRFLQLHKALGVKFNCDVFINANTVTILSTSTAAVRFMRFIVEAGIREGTVVLKGARISFR